MTAVGRMQPATAAIALRSQRSSWGPFPWPRFAVLPSFTLRANETAAELAFVPRSAVRLLPRSQIDTAATRHARSPRRNDAAARVQLLSKR